MHRETFHSRAARRTRAGALGAMLAGAALAACGGDASRPPLDPGMVGAVRPASAGDGGGDDAASCPPATVPPTRYLRQLSMDLRGQPPSADELAQVERDGTVTDAAIDAMLRSPDFLGRVAEWYRPAVWPNIYRFYVSALPVGAYDPDGATTAGDPDDPYGSGQAVFSYSPYPELVTNAAAHPNAVVVLSAYGDSDLRGGSLYGLMGCDGQLAYPAPNAPGMPQPTYDTPSGRYPYYDRDGVPLPYHDWRHCPNYCTDGGGNYAGMTEPGADASPHELDPPGRHCPGGFSRVINSCDSVPDGSSARRFHVRREGYRLMAHYWSGGQMVRTCAYTAQANLNEPVTGSSCAANNQSNQRRCGCGPEGRYCTPSSVYELYAPSLARARIEDALSVEPLRIIQSVVGRDEDFFQVFNTRRSQVDGALAYFYRYQTGSLWIPGGTSGATMLPLDSPAPDALPTSAYDDTDWHDYLRGPQHAGILSTPVYLARFATRRARISQFRTAFLCRPFTPAAATNPSPDDPCTREPNLARRCGCQNCHAAIEPMTAWFGRWSEYSAQYLDPRSYPVFDPYCQQCALTGQGCSDRCRREYVIDTSDADGARFAGTLRGYLYRTPEEAARIDEGPAGLVASALASGELQSCTVRTAWANLLNRPMSENEQGTLLPELLARFAESGNNYRALVRAIVTSAPYRRVD